jgi:hypothetical protein
MKSMHRRIVFGGLFLLVGLLAWLYMGSYFAARQ